MNSELCAEYWLKISLQYDMHFPFHYGRPVAGWPTAIKIHANLVQYIDLFSPPNLGGLLADRHQILSHVRWRL